MSFNAAALKLMLEKGLTLGDVVEIAAVNELRSDPTAAERMRRYRQRKGETRNVTRNEVPPKDNNQTPSGTDLPDEADASSPVRQPITEATEIWNREAAQVGWPQVQSMSASRQKLLGARLRQHGLDGWQAAIAKARASPFLAGHDPPSWFTFPWLIKAENFLKLVEGNYDRRRTEQPTNSMGRHQPADGLSSTARAALQVFGR